MTPSRVHHTGVVVRSMDEALPLYRDVLALALRKEETIEDQGVRAAVLDFGNSFVELLEPVVPDTGIARYLERRGEGLHHVCLEVPDIRAALADLKAKGVQLIDETPRPGLAGEIAFVHPSALHGVLVELVHGTTAYRGPRPTASVHIRRLDHLILAVQQLQDAAADWARVVGLQAEAPYHPDGSHMQLARLAFSDAEGAAFLELAQPTTQDHRLARFIAERGEGMFSISIAVEDLDATVAKLRAKGLSVTDPEAGTWPGTRLARVPRARAHGVALQLIERGT